MAQGELTKSAVPPEFPLTEALCPVTAGARRGIASPRRKKRRQGLSLPEGLAPERPLSSPGRGRLLPFVAFELLTLYHVFDGLSRGGPLGAFSGPCGRGGFPLSDGWAMHPPFSLLRKERMRRARWKRENEGRAGRASGFTNVFGPRRGAGGGWEVEAKPVRLSSLTLTWRVG